MPAKFTLTDAQETHICDLYMKGLKVIEISKEVKIGQQKIYSTLNKFNVYEKFKKHRANKICELYLSGVGMEEIREKEKINHVLISKFLKDGGVEIRFKRGATQISLEQEAEIVRLYEKENWKVADIEKKFELGHKKLKTILKRNGVRLRKTRYLSSIIRTQEQENEILIYVEQGLKIVDIKNRLSFDCSFGAISKFLKKKFPYKTRSLKEIWASRYSPENVKTLLEERENFLMSQPTERAVSYSGRYKGITFRSLKEASYMIFLDENGIDWKSGEQVKLKIPYLDEKGGQHNYWPDFLIEGNKIVEIKPLRHQATPFVMRKEAAAIEFCKKVGFTYEMKDFKPNKQAILRKIQQGQITFKEKTLERFYKHL